VILETDRLALREITPGDLDFLAEMLADPEVARFYPKALTRDETRAWMEMNGRRYAESGHGVWLVLDRHAGHPVGRCGLTIQTVDGVPEPEIGYSMHRPFWRRGYATEAALGVRRWAFEVKGLERVISLVRPENLPSQGVARRLGMAPERETDFCGYRHLVFAVRRADVNQAMARG
jgi:RimJ/RimL family protein N-acetyltransferase